MHTVSVLNLLNNKELLVRRPNIRLSTHKGAVAHFNEINDNQMMSLVYISDLTTAPKHNRAVFDHIEEFATKHNEANNVQGFLCNSENYFIQCLEGSKKSLLALMADIFKDKCHYKVKIILAKPITNCRFNDWQIYGCCLEHDSVNKIAFQLKEFLPFNPTRWPDWQIEHFIEVVSTSAAPVALNKKYITYPYQSDVTLFISYFIIPLVLCCVLLWLLLHFFF